MNRLCTICARGGSKGVTNKNIKLLLGKPLIAHTIMQAKKSGLFNYVAVSSDSEEILSVAKVWGADVLIKRPDELATDQAAKLPVIRHALKAVEQQTGQKFHIHVDLDATSPLRNIADIEGAVNMLESDKGIANVITGALARRSPYFNLVELNTEGYVELSKELSTSIIRRQDSPKCYDMNASIYVWRREVLLAEDKVILPKTALYEMPEERSIDIDSPLDFDFVEFLAIKRGEL